MKYITGKHIVLGLLAVALVLLTGCQSDGGDTVDTPRQNPTMEMEAYTTSYIDAMPKASTRAGEWWPTESFELYKGHDDIRVAFTQGNRIADSYKNGNSTGKQAKGMFKFKSGEGKWGSNFDLPNGGDYYLYGFMSNEGNLDLSPVEKTGVTSYANGANMTMTGLPTVTSSDVCVIVGVKKGVETPEGSGNYSCSGIQVGQFGYTISDGQNHVYLLCDHLYACLRLLISVNATYNALRTIKLKKLWIKDCKNINNNNAITFKSKINGEIHLNTTTSPIQSLAFSHDDTSADLNMEWNPLFVPSVENDGELKVMTKVHDDENCLEIKGYMVPPITFESSPSGPIGITDFTLVSQYDIYDKKGNLIRENQTAENKINIDAIFDPDNLIENMSMERGTRYTIYMTVNPTYLYMMSEPDLDNPTVEIAKVPSSGS